MPGRRPWRLISDPPRSAAWNMSLDEALLDCTLEQPPTLRLYSWSSVSVSLGYRQAVPPWLGRGGRFGVRSVRRISGGGAVLHAGDLTYAVTAALGVLPEGLQASCAWIRDILIEGLRLAGLQVQPSRASPGGERVAVCFAGTTGFEVELDRAKLVGSAQRRTPWGLLQHGSIRLTDDSALYQALLGESPPWPARLPRLDRVAVGAAVQEAFARALEGRIELGKVSELELRVARGRQSARASRPLAVHPPSLRRIAESADTAAG